MLTTLNILLVCIIIPVLWLCYREILVKHWLPRRGPGKDDR